MFVLRDKESPQVVVLGPINWDKYRFQSFVYEVYKVEFALPYQNMNEKVIEINDRLSLWPIRYSPTPEYNQSTESLNGPHWEFDDTHANAYYEVQPKSVAVAREFTKQEVSSYRWKLENTGVLYSIGDSQYLIPTSKEDRINIFNSLPGTWKMKKFHSKEYSPELGSSQVHVSTEFVEISQEQLDEIISLIKNHISRGFEIEKDMHAKLDSCETLEDIASITLDAEDLAEEYSVEFYKL